MFAPMAEKEIREWQRARRIIIFPPRAPSERGEQKKVSPPSVGWVKRGRRRGLTIDAVAPFVRGFPDSIASDLHWL